MKKIKKEKIKREEEEIKRKEEMKKMMIQDSKELKELEEKIKELLNNQSMQNRPTNNKMKECDDSIIIFANKIKEKVEKVIGVKLTIYEPIAYIYEIKENIEYYSIKVRKGDKEYIHIYTTKEKEGMDVGQIKIIFGVSLFDPL